MKISDATSISMPMRNLISIVAAVAVGVWAYFGIIERLNKLETGQVLLDKDMTAEDTRLHTEVTKNTEFRIKYPRGELGQSQNDLEQFMLIEELYKQVEKMEKVLESNMTNKVNIDFLKEQTDKMTKLEIELQGRVGVLEKWRWIIIGGSIVAGFIIQKMLVL